MNDHSHNTQVTIFAVNDNANEYSLIRIPQYRVPGLKTGSRITIPKYVVVHSVPVSDASLDYLLTI